jgi:hypothetical protein
MRTDGVGSSGAARSSLRRSVYEVNGLAFAKSVSVSIRPSASDWLQTDVRWSANLGRPDRERVPVGCPAVVAGGLT